MSKLFYRKDGVDHINIHANAKTELGRRLDNLSHEPFVHPEYGEFASVEGFYWYLVDGAKDDGFRTLHGHDARKIGMLHKNSERHLNGRLTEKAAEASMYKVTQNPDLAELLKRSELPLTCYRRWARKVREGIGYQNHVTVYKLLRDRLKSGESAVIYR